MKVTFFIVALSFPLLLSAGEDVVWPDCYCTDKAGERKEIGERICLTVDGRSYMARCEMSLNNPMWREIGGECLTSFYRGAQSSHPIDSTSSIGAKIAVSIH